ncbi:MAG TPA: DUF2612 domain-containing protein [Bacillota bacterium]|nr:DUF2612 domain-containing protein [Bacillota bacterium]
MSEADNSITRTPHTYSKDRLSLWGKLLSVLTVEIDRIKEVSASIRAIRDIDEAGGWNLDLIGGNVQQGRGKLSDQLYRILIKTKIARNINEGNIDNLIRVISMALGCKETEVLIRERWELEPPKPAGLIIEVPCYALNRVGMTPEQFTALMNRTVATGIGVAALYAGGFSFSSVADQPETDLEFGFDRGILGAYFSLNDGGDELPL